MPNIDPEKYGYQPQARFIDWYGTVAGEYIKDQENQLVTEGLNNLFGYHLVSLGPLHLQEGIVSSPITHKVFVNAFNIDSSRSELLTGLDDLALQNDSVDVLVLPHVLEYSEEPHAILREAERVIHPNGHVVILGFNPLSCYGLCRTLLGFTGNMPWQGHFYHPARLRDWLKLLGFEVMKIRYAVFTPPIQHAASLRYLSFLEKAGKSFLAPMGGVFMIIARNLAVTPNVIRPQWKTRAALIKNGAAEPSSRVVNQRAGIKRHHE